MEPVIARRLAGRFALWTLAAVVGALVAAACSSSPSQPTASSCTITVTQVATTIPAAGGSGSVTVSAGSGCIWTATSGATFITITQGASGTGNGTVQFTVAANTGAACNGTITIAGSTLTIQQAAASATVQTLAAPALQSPTGGQPVDSLTPTLTVANSAATGAVGTVTYHFEVSDTDSFPDGRTQVGDGIAQGGGSTTSWPVPRALNPNTTYFWRVRAAATNLTTAFSNTDSFRTPNVCSFSLSGTTFSIPSGGGTITVNVSAPGTCSWNASSNASFLTITSGSSGTGNGTVTVTVAASSGAGRSGTLTIAGQTVTVNQAGSGVVASFNLLDPSTQAAPTTECQFRSTSTPPQ